MPERDVYPTIESRLDHSPVDPEEKDASRKHYLRDCMRKQRHEDRSIALSEADADRSRRHVTRRKAPTKAEAIRLARGHSTLGPVLESGGDVVLVEPERGRGRGDRVIVGVHDHEGARSLVALVDRNGVVGVHATPAQFQLSQQERAAAEELAAADERAKSFLRRRRMNPLTRLYFPPGDRSGHRHAIVFLRPTSSERRYVVVDLTEARVVDALDEADLTRGADA